MLQFISTSGWTTLLLGSLWLVVASLVRDRHNILHALGLMPAAVPLRAPIPARVRLVSPPHRLAVRYAAALREAA